jgi:hypothetical protein
MAIEITPSQVSYNGSSAADEETISTSTGSVTPILKSSHLMILVENDDTSDLTVTFTATAGAWTGSGIGNASFTAAASGKTWIGPLESHRFADADGDFNFTLATTGSLSGKMSAVELP